jgi:hypothetical protein
MKSLYTILFAFFGLCCSNLSARENSLPANNAVTSFTAVQSENTILLEWYTINTENISEFIIEKSGDGIYYRTVALVTPLSVPYTSNQNNYKDTEPMEGISYYRIHIKTINGSTYYSPIVYIEYKSKSHFHNYPNPSLSGDISVEIPYHNTEVIVTGATGRIISRSFFAEPGNYQLNLFNIDGKFVQGNYFIFFNSKEVKEQITQIVKSE